MKTPNKYPVIVSNGHETYYGELWYEYPVDEPALVSANGQRFYEYIWEQKGWTVEYDD